MDLSCFGKYISIVNKGAANSATAILNTAIVVGFAGVVRVTAGSALFVHGNC
ncbi:hypothetical protein [Dethiosulfatibacter aminovorans]|uniref:hypothetical protein n=1 Tax=Dethiosulfatibacter aminovorans TaxID=332095 RepID=UPI000B275526|nr:hypothetical protein [Dethiosulfatibacter aminovorans]